MAELVACSVAECSEDIAYASDTILFEVQKEGQVYRFFTASAIKVQCLYSMLIYCPVYWEL